MLHLTKTSRLRKGLLNISIILLLPFWCSGTLYSQFQSINSITGKWLEPTTWISNTSPSFSVNGDDVTIYGEIFSDDCLEFNRSVLTISDTLVINGNLSLKNTCSLIIEPEGLLIVLGDYVSNNQVEVLNNGIILIAGGFEMLGADNQGTYLNNNKSFLFDPTPIIKNGADYESILCTVSGTDTTCGYLSKDDYLLDPIRTYVESLPYNINEVSPELNTCSGIQYTVEIVLDKQAICNYETIEVSAKTTGIDDLENLNWNFGLNAIPKTANGPGPHTISYSESGITNIELTSLSDASVKDTASIQIYKTPENITEITGDNFDDNYPEYIEVSNQGQASTLYVNGDSSMTYHWSIPNLAIDTIGKNHIDLIWNTAIGLSNVAVYAISINGCHSDTLRGDVHIIENTIPDCSLGDSCPKISIIANNTELCELDNVEFNAVTENIEYVDSLLWNFGADAYPEYASGIGPHKVTYTSKGDKAIELSYLPNSSLLTDTTIHVYSNPAAINQIIGLNFDKNKPEFVESICQEEQSILLAEGDTNLQYLWQIPSLDYEKTGNYSIVIDWNSLQGSQSVYVSVISANNCVSEQTEVKIEIKECKEEDIFKNDTYAFTPNSDGYNDFWVIDDIKNYPLAQIRVYDNTGILVYESRGYYNNDWDGTHQGYVLPIDSYYFIIDLTAYQKDHIRGILTILHD